MLVIVPPGAVDTVNRMGQNTSKCKLLVVSCLMSTKSSRSRSPSLERATTIFERHGGILRMADALRLGIHRRTLYALRDAGTIEPLSRGLYRLAGAPILGNPDLVA